MNMAAGLSRLLFRKKFSLLREKTEKDHLQKLKPGTESEIHARLNPIGVLRKSMLKTSLQLTGWGIASFRLCFGMPSFQSLWPKIN
jgi:hypothetical protein